MNIYKQLLGLAVPVLCLFFLSSSIVFCAALEIELSSSRIPQGGVFLVSASGPAKPLEISCSLDGTEFPFFDSPVLGTQRAIGGVSWKASPGPRRMVVSGRDCFGENFLKVFEMEVLDGSFRNESLKVAPKMANPPQELTDRIRQEGKLLREITSKVSETAVAGAFARPVAGKVMSPFGTRRTFNGQVKSRHSGVDLRASMGRPIRATNQGIVVLVRNLYYSGDTVVLDHGLGIFSLYAHLSNYDVAEGEVVERGQVVGRAGMSGRVTGPHLHWGVKMHGFYISPLALLDLPLIPAATSSAYIARAYGP